MIVAELLTDSFRRAGLTTARAESRQALDAALDPRAGGVCLGFSHDGGTRATKLALEAARERGAHDRVGHRVRRSLVLLCRRPGLRHPHARRLLVPHPRLHERHPGRGTYPGIAGDEATGAAVRAMESTLERARRLRGRCGAPEPLGPHRHRRPGHRPGERRRAGPQDRRGGAHRHHRATTSRRCCTATSPAVMPPPRASCCSPLTRAPAPRRDRRFALVAQAARAIGIPTVALAPQALLTTLPAEVQGVALERPSRRAAPQRAAAERPGGAAPDARPRRA